MCKNIFFVRGFSTSYWIGKWCGCGAVQCHMGRRPVCSTQTLVIKPFQFRCHMITIVRSILRLFLLLQWKSRLRRFTNCTINLLCAWNWKIYMSFWVFFRRACERVHILILPLLLISMTFGSKSVAAHQFYTHLK